jgi:hypothetical protein
MIELVGKTLKTNDKQEARKQRSVEALACSCEHPSVIKFLAIHIETMEAYTLWWNGGTLQKMLDYNTKYFPLWIIVLYCNKGGWIWKGEHNLSPLR